MGIWQRSPDRAFTASPRALRRYPFERGCAGVLLAAFIGIGAARADADPVAGKGQFGLCESCHGTAAAGNRELGAPSLTGLQAVYVVRQLESFRSGLRGASAADEFGRQMRPMAQALPGTTAIADVAAYVATLPRVKRAATLQGDVANGKALYVMCAPCHGANAEGKAEFNAPALNQADDWYLVRQLQNFRSGIRGALPADTLGAQMRAIAAGLPNEQALRDVVAHVKTLEWTLNPECPPSFEKLDDRSCQFRSLYDLYESAPGHGGLRARPPDMRERFTPEQIDLGRYLFFDPVLSQDGSRACANCHQPNHGFSEAQPRSTAIAVTGRAAGLLQRNAPSLWNAGFLPRLFWDGRASSLQEQARGPLFAADEMANTPVSVQASLNALPAYRSLFAAAFRRDESQQIQVDEVVQALAAFESSLVSFNSRYDRYAHGDAHALTDLEQEGYSVFRGFVARCSQCHIPPLFTDGELAVVGAPAVASESYDMGAGGLSQDPALAGAFKVPTLRNVARTAPYFNAGQFATLREVVQFYNDKRGHAVPPGIDVQVHWHLAMTQPLLSEHDVNAIVAFLQALTDESLLPKVPVAVPSGLPVRAPSAAAREHLTAKSAANQSIFNYPEACSPCRQE
jgi:cytochrome c peroxidase